MEHLLKGWKKKVWDEGLRLAVVRVPQGGHPALSLWRSESLGRDKSKILKPGKSLIFWTQPRIIVDFKQRIPDCRYIFATNFKCYIDFEFRRITHKFWERRHWFSTYAAWGEGGPAFHYCAGGGGEGQKRPKNCVRAKSMLPLWMWKNVFDRQCRSVLCEKLSR